MGTEGGDKCVDNVDKLRKKWWGGEKGTNPEEGGGSTGRPPGGGAKWGGGQKWQRCTGAPDPTPKPPETTGELDKGCIRRTRQAPGGCVGATWAGQL